MPCSMFRRRAHGHTSRTRAPGDVNRAAQGNRPRSPSIYSAIPSNARGQVDCKSQNGCQTESRARPSRPSRVAALACRACHSRASTGQGSRTSPAAQFETLHTRYISILCSVIYSSKPFFHLLVETLALLLLHDDLCCAPSLLTPRPSFRIISYTGPRML
jgi:hypothetical protein